MIPFPPLANLFPLLDGEEFDAFVADIKAHGLRQRIVLCNGAILEGRNRYRACIEAGIEPRFEQFNGRDPLAYVVSLNLARRHLNESQRAMVHARIATLPKGSNQHTAIAAPTQERAAALLNISIDSGQRARKVLEQGIPALAGKVDRGDMSVSAAAEVARLAESEQREIILRAARKKYLRRLGKSARNTPRKRKPRERNVKLRLAPCNARFPTRNMASSMPIRHPGWNPIAGKAAWIAWPTITIRQ